MSGIWVEQLRALLNFTPLSNTYATLVHTIRCELNHDFFTAFREVRQTVYMLDKRGFQRLNSFLNLSTCRYKIEKMINKLRTVVSPTHTGIKFVLLLDDHQKYSS
jgi:hypothetical protein